MALKTHWVYTAVKKNKLNQTQNKQAVHHRAPATLARGRGKRNSALPGWSHGGQKGDMGSPTTGPCLLGTPLETAKPACLETGWLIASAPAGRVIFQNQLPLVVGNLQVCSPELSTPNEEISHLFWG